MEPERTPSRLLPRTDPPLVSVVVPVYNQGEYVRSAIESVLAQGYAPLELTVIDDGSTDGTPEVLREFEGRAHLIRQENRGAAAALNRGIRAARGPLVCWLSADDEFLPGKLEAQVAAFLESPDVGMVHTGYTDVDGSGAVLRTAPVPAVVDADPFVNVFWRNSTNGSTVMLRRDVFDELGGFDETLRADVDADMWMRIAMRWPIAAVPGVYVRYRVHRNSLSANVPLMVASMTAVRRRHLDELRRRVADRPDAPTLLARMSADFAAQRMDELAGTLLAESRRHGRASRHQARAALALGANRLRRNSVVRALFLGARRRWRSRGPLE